MEKDNRPLSPHLQVYRLPMAALMSITHRATGVASVLGLLLLTCWLARAASGVEGWHSAKAMFSNPFIVLLLFFWTGSLVYHFCNGIRHLMWDVGHGLTIEGVRKSGRVVLIATIVITLMVWICISLL